MNHLLRTITRFWPIGILCITEMILILTNYRPGTYLMGWDNVMPEFNFATAFITNIFGAWQEHRGVGLPDGMGHAANLVHTSFLWLLSLVLPQHMLRYAFHFLMHLLGMVGMYFLLGIIIPNLKHDTSPSQKQDSDSGAGMTRTIGALFYGLNLVTIQMFYTPLEAFSIHFAALPWLAYTLTRYLKSPHHNTLLLFITASILSVPQFFIPTLILPTAFLLVAISLPYIRMWKYVLIAATTFIIINASWALPYIVHLPQNAPIIQDAKINQMTSNEVYLRNQVFGDLKNVLTMRGFMLDFEDVNTEGLPIYIMDAWRTFTLLPGIQLASLLLAGIALIGWLRTLVTRGHRPMVPYTILYGGTIVLLATNTPVLTNIMAYIRDASPLFREAYRFPFTKFSLLFGMSASVCLMYGIYMIKESHIRMITVIVMLTAIIGISFPSFRGQFFYDAMRVELPIDYQQLFVFMDKQDHTGRTAYLPSPSYWSWKHYKFGYIGSGFLWYGLSQPLLDRAFDPWSNTNENYYWELSRALYAKDINMLSNVFQKYDIRYIILDENLWAPGHDRSLFLDDTKTILNSLPDVRIIGQTETISVYERSANTTAFVSMTNTLPWVVPPYTWTDNDTAYKEIGDYTNTPIDKVTNLQSDNANTLIYPFRSLFTKRAINEREFTIDESSDHITINSNTLQDSTIPSILIDTTTPLFSAADEGFLTPQAIRSCGVLTQGSATGQAYEEDGAIALRIKSSKQRGCLQFDMEPLRHTHAYLIRIKYRHISGRPLMLSLISDTAKHGEIETLLAHDDGNQPSMSANWQTDYFLLPPLGIDGQGYSVYLTNDAIGDIETVNDIRDVTVYQVPDDLPTNSLTGTTIGERQTTPSAINALMVTHPNPSDYTITIPPQEGTKTLILSQAYNDNWRAYDTSNLTLVRQLFPWIFGKILTDHYMVNNWKNGWSVPEGTTQVHIIYVPQLFSYAGYLLILVSGLLLVLRGRRRADRPHRAPAHIAGQTSQVA